MPVDHQFLGVAQCKVGLHPAKCGSLIIIMIIIIVVIIFLIVIINVIISVIVVTIITVVIFGIIIVFILIINSLSLIMPKAAHKSTEYK